MPSLRQSSSFRGQDALAPGKSAASLRQSAACTWLDNLYFCAQHGNTSSQLDGTRSAPPLCAGHPVRGRHLQHGGPADHHHRPRPHQGRIRGLRYRHGAADRHDLRRLLRHRRLPHRALGGRRLAQDSAGGLPRLLEPDDHPWRHRAVVHATRHHARGRRHRRGRRRPHQPVDALRPVSAELPGDGAGHAVGIQLVRHRAGRHPRRLAFRHVHLAHRVFSLWVRRGCCLPSSFTCVCPNPGAAPPMDWWTIGKRPACARHLRT